VPRPRRLRSRLAARHRGECGRECLSRQIKRFLWPGTRRRKKASTEATCRS
jgi:hypothetical protein